MDSGIFLIVSFWIIFGVLVGISVIWLINAIHLHTRFGRFTVTLLGSIAPFIILYNMNATSSATDGWGLYTLPLSVAGAYLGYELPKKPVKFTLLILCWQMLVGIIAVTVYWAIMDYNDYSFTYYPAQNLFYGLDYTTTLNKLNQAYNNEIKATILYCVTTTLLLTFPFLIGLNRIRNLFSFKTNLSPDSF
jgi:hypothetical protein